MSDYQQSNVSLLWTEATTHTSHHKCIESRPWSGSGTELRRRIETDRICQQRHDPIWATLCREWEGNTRYSVCLWTISWIYVWKAGYSTNQTAQQCT
jgi:hypothetical protein